MTNETTKTVKIQPMDLDIETHQKLEKIQSFLHMTTKGRKFDKPQACAYLVKLAIPLVEKKMRKFIQV